MIKKCFAMRTFAGLLALACKLYCYAASPLTNASFETGLQWWVHDQNTYPIGSVGEPIGADGNTVANLGTFDQTGSYLTQIIHLESDSDFRLSFDFGVNSGNLLGRTGSVRVTITNSNWKLLDQTVSEVSVGYPNRALGFSRQVFDFKTMDALSGGDWFLTFFDTSPNSGISADPMVDNVQISTLPSGGAPFITAEPLGRELRPGESLYLSVAAMGAAPLGFRWFRNGVAIPDATNSYVLRSGAAEDLVGEYFVIVRNLVGSTQSKSALVSISTTTNLILNGSFEAGLDGWEHDISVWEIAAGTQGAKAANLGTFDQPGSFLSQAFAVHPGRDYTLLFSTAANAVGVLGVDSYLGVSVATLDGEIVVSNVFNDVSAGLPSGALGFTSRRIDFTTSAAMDRLRLTFRDVTPGGGRGVDQMVDSISVSEVFVGEETTLVIPNGARNSENGGASAALSVPIRFQEVYSANNFPSYPVLITELRLRPDSTYGFAVDEQLSRIRFVLSSTLKAPGDLSVNFDENFGVDQTVVYDGPWRVTSSFLGPFQGPKAFDIVLPLHTPFLYDPSQGNLLVEIRNYGTLSARFHNDGFVAPQGVQRIFTDGNPDAKIATAGDASADVIEVSIIPDIHSHPVILEAPLGATVDAGDDVVLNVVARGAPPLHFQWFHDGQALAGATNDTLRLNRAKNVDAGFYSVTVSNPNGTATSDQAFILVRYPPTMLEAGSLQIETGAGANVPIHIQANGIEADIRFTLSFPVNLVTYGGTVLASSVKGANLQVDTSQLDLGRIGIIIARPGGLGLAQSNQVLCSLEFVANSNVVATTSSAIAFGSSPVQQSVLDAKNRPVQSVYQAGRLVVVFVGFESDLASQQAEAYPLTTADWLYTARLIAGLESATNILEFRKADSAPRVSRGDGRLTCADLMQCGRYAGRVDPITVAGGSSYTAKFESEAVADPGEASVAVFLGSRSEVGYGDIQVPINTVGTGEETAMSISLSFDPGILRFREARTSKATLNWKLLTNDKQSRFGRIGFVIAPIYGRLFPKGTNELMVLRFHVLKDHGDAPLFSFSDVPVFRSVCNTQAIDLPCYFGGESVENVQAVEILEIVESSGLLSLSWRLSPVRTILESAQDLGLLRSEWSTVDETVLQVGDRFFVSFPTRKPEQFFRLRLDPNP